LILCCSRDFTLQTKHGVRQCDNSRLPLQPYQTSLTWCQSGDGSTRGAVEFHVSDGSPLPALVLSSFVTTRLPMVGLPRPDGGHGEATTANYSHEFASHATTPASFGRPAVSSFPCFRILAHPGVTEQRLSQDKAERQL
jgi:hypothetical protein